METSRVAEIVLKVNGDDVNRKMKELQARLGKAREEIDKLYEANKGVKLSDWADKDRGALTRLNKEVSSCTHQLGRMQLTGDGVKKVLDTLDKSTIKDLNRSLRTMKKALSEVERGSEEWNSLTEAIKKTKEEIKKATTEQETFEKSQKGVDKWGYKWVGLTTIISQAYSAIEGAINRMGGAVSAFAQMEEVEADVRKYTGLTTEQVKELNEEFKKMDTRTPREQLNALAADAGRLGIEGKEGVMEFVEAADMINVALGEDLGEDAVKSIGKLAQLFGDDKKMGLKGAMLATASTINDLGQSSSASEGYIVDFTGRLAGAGRQAGMTQAQIMALASVLDQSMVNAEEGSTALSKIIQKIYREPQEMAAAAGLDVKAFTDLVKTDANAALLQFAEAVSKMGGMEKIAPMLGDMSLTGAGVSKTLMALAGNIDLVRQTQEQATKSFQEGTSVQKEYDVANNTVQAQLEKAKNRAHDLYVELGERLYPVMRAGISVNNLIVSVIIEVVKWLSQHKATVLVVAAAVATYTIAVNANTIASKVSAATTALMTTAVKLYRAGVVAATLVTTLLTQGVKAATVAFKGLNAAMKKNIFGLILAGIAAAIVAVVNFITRTKELTEAQRVAAETQQNLNEVQKIANEQNAAEKLRIERLTAIIHDNTRSIKDRKGAIDALRKIIPDYHAEIGREGEIIRENKKAIDDYIANLDRKALAEAMYEKIKKNAAEQTDAELAVKSWENAVSYREAQKKKPGHESKKVTTTYTDPRGLYSWTTTVETNETRKQDNETLAYNKARLEFWQERNKALKQQRETYDKYIKEKDLQAELDKIAFGENRNVITPLGNEFPTGDPVETEEQRKARDAAERKAEAAKKKAEAEQRKRNKEREAEEERAGVALLQKAMQRYAVGQDDAETYRLAIQSIEQLVLENKRDIWDKESEEYKEHNDALIKLQQKHASEVKNWSIADLNRQEKEAKSAAKMRYTTGVISERQHQEEVNRITLEYLRRRRDLYQEFGDVTSFEKEQAAFSEELNKQKLDKQKRFRELWEAEMRRLNADYDALQVMKDELDVLQEQLKNNLLDYNTYLKLVKQAKDKYAQSKKDRLDDAKSKDGWNNGVESALSSGNNEWATVMKQIGEALTAKKRAFMEIDKLEQQGVITHAEAEERKRQITQDKYGQIVQIASAAYAAVSAVMSAASDMMQAELSLEEAKITQRYDKEIEAAGENSTKAGKLEEKKQKELSALKNRYNRKMMAVEIAQAVAQTAMNALMAYGSVVKIPIVGPALAVAAAAAATAAGLIQVATIKKQHEAQAAGYYEGGFTGGDDYRREAGVVHQGEFVANHLAVKNPAIAPILRLIDHAQRTNRVASLTAADVSRAVAAPLATATPGTTPPAAPTVTVVDTSSRETAEALRRLNERLEAPIETYVVLDGPDGLDSRWRRYNKLKGKTGS